MGSPKAYVEAARFKLEDGFDFLFYSNGNIAKTKLNEVVQNSIGLGLILKIHIVNHWTKHYIVCKSRF